MGVTTGVDTAGWSEFWSRWDKVLKQIPDARKSMLTAMGDKLTDEVRQQIIARGINDARGRVRSWQQPRVGSGRGYVAVSPKSVEVLAGGTGKQKINAGHLTQILESGHPVRTPSGRAKRYEPRFSSRSTLSRVSGREFYDASEAGAQRVGMEEANAFMRKLEESLNDQTG